MASNQFERAQVSAYKLRGTGSAILMVDAVESVAVNTAFEPLIGPRIHNRRPRHSAMKSGVENRDLGNLTQHLFDNLDTFEFSAIVEGGERRNPGNSRFHFGSEPNRLFVFRAAMH